MSNAVINPYKLIRSRRRTIALMVTPEATVVVRAPAHTPLEIIERFVGNNAGWIERAIARLRQRPQIRKKEFVGGETFFFLGKSCPLQVRNDATEPLHLSDGFILDAKARSRGRALFIAWYKKEAKRVIAERVDWWARRFGLAYHSVNITHANRRWGSCSPTDRLNFSWRLVMAPVEVIDYVVVHELAHIVHKNHSKRFWDKVKAMYPDYKSAQAWLRVNEGMLNL